MPPVVVNILIGAAAITLVVSALTLVWVVFRERRATWKGRSGKRF